MHTAKRYTNTTFTRRVDREAGRHRPQRALKGVRVCRRCGAVYFRRRWRLEGVPDTTTLRAVAAPIATICPACAMAVSGRFAGELRVSGGFARTHRPEIERLLRREEQRAASDNPLGRIAAVIRKPSRLTVRTTTEHLAKRLGEALHKAFSGTVHYEFSHENKFAHVTWSREL